VYTVSLFSFAFSVMVLIPAIWCETEPVKRLYAVVFNKITPTSSIALHMHISSEM
jgi:hypothetical protein